MGYGVHGDISRGFRVINLTSNTWYGVGRYKPHHMMGYTLAVITATIQQIIEFLLWVFHLQCFFTSITQFYVDKELASFYSEWQLIIHPLSVHCSNALIFRELVSVGPTLKYWSNNPILSQSLQYAFTQICSVIISESHYNHLHYGLNFYNSRDIKFLISLWNLLFRPPLYLCWNEAVWTFLLQRPCTVTNVALLKAFMSYKHWQNQYTCYCCMPSFKPHLRLGWLMF